MTQIEQVAPVTTDSDKGMVTTLDLLLIVRNVESNIAAIAAQSGLTLTQVYTLYTITECNEESSMRWMAEALGCDPSNVTGIIEKMVHQGLVVRQESPQDRRRKTVQLTAEGTRRIEEVMNAIPGRIGEPQVTRDEMKELRRILLKLNDSFPAKVCPRSEKTAEADRNPT